MKNLNKILVDACEQAIGLQHENGQFLKGRNGPHNHNMTPVRNTAHIALAFTEAFRITENPAYSSSASNAMDYILSSSGRPIKGAFWKRKEKLKSSQNGLIGQAWCLESLIYCGEVLKKKSLIEEALEIFELHEFDRTSGLWHQIGLDGSVQQIDSTLNQQVWMAAIACLLSKYDTSKLKNVEIFLSKLKKNELSSKTLFCQELVPDQKILLKSAKVIRRKLRQLRDTNVQKNIGYHIFTLCGLARIYEKLPNNDYFKDESFQKKTSNAFSSDFIELMKGNKYSFHYNVPGLELLYVYDTFKEMLDCSSLICARKVLDFQIKEACSFNIDELDDDLYDAATLFSRVYEIYRIPNWLR